MKLVRAVDCESPMRLRRGSTARGVRLVRGALLAAGIVSLLALQLGPQLVPVGLSHWDATHISARAIAGEGYRVWKQQHPDARCPHALHELTGVIGHDGKDVWGQPFELYCKDTAPYVVVRSIGEDGVRATEDDVWSHL